MGKIAIGIDVGGTNTVFGIVDSAGNVLRKNSIPTPDHGNYNIYISDLATKVKELLGGKKKDLWGIGIGAPNANHYTGKIEQAPNLSFRGIVPFLDKFKEHFPGLNNISLTNDANAATYGEMIFGGAKRMKNFALYTLGTGVGSGLVVNGELIHGDSGFAGECGHTMLVPDGRLCGCGINGHLEAYCSATGITRTALELMAKYNAIESPIAETPFKDLSSKIIYDAAMDGDKLAKEVFEITGRYLGMGLANTVHHTSPEAIFLFGGPLAAGDLILSPTRESFEEHLIPVFKNTIQIIPSQLDEGEVAIVGAGSLAFRK